MSTHFAHKIPPIKKVRVIDAPYLRLLADIPQTPSWLYCLGTVPETRRPTVAIIGSRKPTSYGREVTTQIADRLARRGIVIVSGLAFGIDAIAHQAALDAGGTTIAIQANGLHELAPRANRILGQRIIEKNGAILSEYEPGVEAMRHQFLERNRIVSGLADVVIITEAASRSGTLNTAAHALEQGRDIYAVPGNITSPMSAGCNRLIAQGAKPLLDIDELLDDFLPDTRTNQQILPLGNTSLESAIIAALADGLRDGSELMSVSGASASDFNATITMLEINGAVKPLGNNRWSLR